ncbi:MAG: hypothetical protein M3T55_07425 [Pseudomonadota bacterium]|nr:hypothetical protein [Pseudomonadota bacterium]
MSRRSFSSILLRTARLADRRRAGEMGHSQTQAKSEYIEHRRLEADTKNERLAKALRYLNTILSVGIERDARVSIDSLIREPDLAGPATEAPERARPDSKNFNPPPLGLVAAFLPGAKRKQAEALAAADARFGAALAEWERLTAKRNLSNERRKTDADAHYRQREALRAALAAGEPDAVISHAQRVLANSPYPDIFHHDVKIGLGAVANEFVVELRAPTVAEIVSKTERFEYRKEDDKIIAVAKPEKDRQILYDNTIAQLALRTLHEMFSSDVGHHIVTIVMNIFVLTIEPSTGKTIRPNIVSARVSRAEFDDLDLAAVDPVACLKRLMAPSV